MFSWFGRDDRKTKTVLIADIGSSSVALSLAELNREGPPTLHVSERVDTAIDSSRGAEALLAAIQKALREAGNYYHSALARRLAATPEHARQRLSPSHAALFLRAPWCDVFLRNIRFSRSTPFRVTPALLERMLSDYVRREHPDEKGETVVERSAVGIRLNGYAVTDLPHAAEVLSAELTALSVTMPTPVLKTLRQEVSSFAGGVHTSAHAASIAASFALGSMVPEEGDYLLCDVGGETTELMLVLEHIPTARATFRLGSAIFERTLKTHAGMQSAEVSSAMRLAANRDSSMRERLGDTLGAAQKEYGTAFAAAFRQLAAASGSASVLYLLCNDASGPWLKDAITQSAPGPQTMDVRLIGPELFGPYAPHSPAGSPDPALALFAMFADARFDEHRTFNFKL